jgi:Zn-finger nucleic acid-binding protein
MKHSLRYKLIDFAHFRGVWINGGEFEKYTMVEGYKASNGSRICRKLAEEGIFSNRYTDKGFVEYKYNSPNKQETLV